MTDVQQHKQIGMEDIRSQRDQLKKHFREEIKSKSEIQKIERDIEN